jgi:trans-2,3-dihydro-3-hydroxyanthranilate isomerase
LREYRFETVDVFTHERFGGNQLAVVTAAEGMTSAEMQKVAREFNLSETVFVLPPDGADCDAVVRIFTRSAEMPFAGHPSIGSACVIAAAHDLEQVRLRQPAGIVRVEIKRNREGDVIGGTFAAPQPFAILQDIDRLLVASCIGIEPAHILTRTHHPVRASVGVDFVLAEINAEALREAAPDLSGFQAAARHYPDYSRFSLLAYHRSGDQVEARMFAPLGGTWEDPATGSANGALGSLLLHVSGGDRIDLSVKQGLQIERPSELRVTAFREGSAIHATVSGGCVRVMQGTVRV